jgi:hypothetical protein
VVAGGRTTARALPVSPKCRQHAQSDDEIDDVVQRQLLVVHRHAAELPQTAIHVLNNGRAFAATDVVKASADVRHPNLLVGIPIYAALDTVHDYVVQAKGTFDETGLGVLELKLKTRASASKIRVVLHAITAPRLAATCRWLVRNMPFVDRVALMGLENTGFAIANDELLWIDPLDYRDQLAEAVDVLVASKVPYRSITCGAASSPARSGLTQGSPFPTGRTRSCRNVIAVMRSRVVADSSRPGGPHYSRGIQPISN